MTSEHDNQVSFFHFVRLKAIGDERYRNIYAVPNWGIRSHAQREYLHQEGMSKGVLDINIDWPSNGYHGMKIEMKHGKGKLSNAQKEWKKRYEKAGYYVVVCYDFEQACQELIAYFNEGERC